MICISAASAVLSSPHSSSTAKTRDSIRLRRSGCVPNLLISSASLINVPVMSSLLCWVNRPRITPHQFEPHPICAFCANHRRQPPKTLGWMAQRSKGACRKPGDIRGAIRPNVFGTQGSKRLLALPDLAVAALGWLRHRQGPQNRQGKRPDLAVISYLFNSFLRTIDKGYHLKPPSTPVPARAPQIA